MGVYTLVFPFMLMLQYLQCNEFLLVVSLICAWFAETRVELAVVITLVVMATWQLQQENYTDLPYKR
jgi:hypothetical protein